MQTSWIMCTEGVCGQVAIDALNWYEMYLDWPLVNNPSTPQLTLAWHSIDIS